MPVYRECTASIKTTYNAQAVDSPSTVVPTGVSKFDVPLQLTQNVSFSEPSDGRGLEKEVGRPPLKIMNAIIGDMGEPLCGALGTWENDACTMRGHA